MPAKESVPLLSEHDRDHVSGARYGTIERPENVRSLTDQHSGGPDHSVALPVAFLSIPSVDRMSGTLHRGLSSRQVQMIAIAGTIGTGLFLGTGRSLAQGGPASMLICYGIVSIIVYITLLLLGEMATQYPVAGECLVLFYPRKLSSDRPRCIEGFLFTSSVFTFSLKTDCIGLSQCAAAMVS